MFGNLFRRDIEEVFTPRKADVNEDMYVERKDLEEALKSRLFGSQHIVIHGESGCGKSWLYKKVLADGKVFWIGANFANASRFGWGTSSPCSMIEITPGTMSSSYW